MRPGERMAKNKDDLSIMSSLGVQDQIEEKTRNGILSTPSVNPPRKQRMSFRQRSVTYVKSFLRAFTREKRYPTCFKFRFVSSPLSRLSFNIPSSSQRNASAEPVWKPYS